MNDLLNSPLMTAWVLMLMGFATLLIVWLSVHILLDLFGVVNCLS
jgi:hypothetical protein